jgi:hypothetical protein
MRIESGKKHKSRVRAWILAVTALTAIATIQTGQAQSTAPRMGGPRDWSHNQFVGARAARVRARAEWRNARRERLLEANQQRRNARLTRLMERLARRGDTSTAPAAATGGAVLDWNLRTGGYGSVIGSPAKWSWDITQANCSDVMYFTVNQQGRTTPQRAVNVIGITQPYAGCAGNPTGQTPTVKFGIALPYGTSTSPVLSLDGNVLYVFQSRPSANGGPILHAINVNNITTNPGAYNFGTQTWTSVHTLAAPNGTATSEQLFQITFAGITNSVSSPFLDYAGNQIFFGDSAGRIRRVRNVHLTTASQDTTNYPVQCGTATLQPPVFVNDQVVTTSANGRIYRIDTAAATPYTCIASAQGGTGTSTGGALSAPVIDVVNEKIIITTNEATGFNARGIGVFDLTFPAGATFESAAYLGPGEDTIAPQSPTFDEAFWSTNNGNMYAVGSPSTGSGTYLIRVPYNGGTLGTPAGYATLRRTGAAAMVATSSVTQFLTASPTNPDFIFVGGGGGTYLFMNRISAGFGGTENAPVNMASGFAVPGGVISGISIDTRTTNMTGTTATANVYFGTIGISPTTQSTIVQVAQAF